jgi:hypothetical protein
MARGAPPSTPYTSDVEEMKTCVIYVLGNNKRIQIKDSKNRRGGSPKELRPRILQLGSSTGLCRSPTIHGGKGRRWVHGGGNASQRMLEEQEIDTNRGIERTA